MSWYTSDALNVVTAFHSDGNLNNDPAVADLHIPYPPHNAKRIASAGLKASGRYGLVLFKPALRSISCRCTTGMAKEIPLGLVRAFSLGPFTATLFKMPSTLPVLIL